MPIAFVGLGSNLGDRARNLGRAVLALQAIDGIEAVELSSFLDTAPVGGPPQPDYLNAVLRCRTSLTPHELLGEMLSIEATLGRERSVINGPRTIDLDLLMYDDVRMAEPELQLPHPRLEERRFVIEPLAELDPELMLAGGMTAQQRLTKLMDI